MSMEEPVDSELKFAPLIQVTAVPEVLTVPPSAVEVAMVRLEPFNPPLALVVPVIVTNWPATGGAPWLTFHE